MISKTYLIPDLIYRDLYYIAGPYSSANPDVLLERERLHAEYSVLLKSRGLAIYSPISETVSLAKHGKISETNWTTWRDHDLNLLARCDVLLILMLPGWKESVGVRGEVKFALKNNIPIKFVTLDCSLVNTDVLAMFEIDKVEDLND